MPVLKSLESKIAGVVEGTFSRVFRSEVRPVEIARKLAREMEEHQYGTLSRTYVPNEYRVYLSPRDRDRFGTLRGGARGRARRLPARARASRALRAALAPGDRVRDRRALEAWRVRHRDLASSSRKRRSPSCSWRPNPSRSGSTMVFSAAQRIAEPLEENANVRQQRALLIYGGRRLMVGPRGATLGRSRECEIVIEDPNVSRQHAELRPRGGAWVVSDLGSTNGTRLNGRTVHAPEVVRPGDEIEVGSSVITFELE